MSKEDILPTIDEDLPEFVQKGLEASRQDIIEWVEKEQEEGESFEEAYERIRGNPDIEDLERMLLIDRFEEEDAKEMKEAIDDLRDKGETKEELKDLFKDE